MAPKKKIENQEKKQIYTQLTKTFYTDLDSPNLLYAMLIRSPYSKGLIKEIKLENPPKDVFLFTAKDFNEQNYIETLDIQTEILASNEVNYKGQPIAIIAGPDFNQLKYLSSQIHIDIEKQSPQKDYPYAQRTIKNGKAHNPEEFQKLFTKKNFDIKGNWTCTLNAPSCKEPNGAFCCFEKNILTIYTPTQWPKHLQENLCRVFNLKQDDIAIKKTVSFSPHTNTIWINTVLAIQAALITIKTKRPVKLTLSRNEEIDFMIKKSPITIKIRTAVKKDGFIEANQILIGLDSGYHNPFAAEILDRLVIAANNFYSIRNFEIIAKAYESNIPPVSFNIESIDSQALFAIENQIQKICKVTGFLPTDFRLKNYERKLSMPFSFSNERVKEAISSIEKLSDLNRKHVAYSLEDKNTNLSTSKISNIPMRGIGLACGFNGVGYYGSNIFACNQKMDTTLETDGSCTIHALPPSNSTFEIWKNTINQILDIDPKHIKLNSKFNSKNDLEIPESINSNLTIMNYLLKKCCLDIQSKRFRKPLPIFSSKGITAAQKKSWNKDKFSGVPFFVTSHAVICVEVEVNPYTYQISVKQIRVIINAGKIALPKIAETSVKLAIQHTLSELIEGETLECKKISISFMTSENEPIQIDGLISKILPAAFSSAVSQAISKEISTIPMKTDQIFKELSNNENSSNSK